MLRILLLLFVCQIGLAAPYVVKDLRPDWRAHTTNGYEPLSSTSDKLDAVYFEIEVSRFPGHHLSVEDSAPFSLFVNGKLIYAGKSHILTWTACPNVTPTSMDWHLHPGRIGANVDHHCLCG